MTSGLRVYVSDAQAAGYCMKGCREYAARCGLDWNDLLVNGVPVERLEEMNDGLANRIVAQARLARGVVISGK